MRRLTLGRAEKAEEEGRTSPCLHSKRWCALTVNPHAPTPHWHIQKYFTPFLLSPFSFAPSLQSLKSHPPHSPALDPRKCKVKHLNWTFWSNTGDGERLCSSIVFGIWVSFQHFSCDFAFRLKNKKYFLKQKKQKEEEQKKQLDNDYWSWAAQTHKWLGLCNETTKRLL